MTKTTAEFIQDAQAKHGTRYGYDKVVYIRDNSKVIITCQDHGDFEQAPKGHLNSNGCSECAGMKPLTTEIFIIRAQKVHGDSRYGYDKVVYNGLSKKVTIVCHIHGDFEQEAKGHMRGAGCPECGGTLQLTTKTFIEKSRKIHSEKYNYDKVEYNISHEKVIITCPDHGDFEQMAMNHLNGSGCSGCTRLTTEQFITKAQSVHGEKYNYDKVEYTTSHEKIIITCPDHGDFIQKPSNHLSGSGCAGCAVKGFDATKPGILYHIFFNLVDDKFTHLEKIGITNRSVDKRFSEKERASFDFYREYHFENGADALAIEKMILNATKSHTITQSQSPTDTGWTEIRSCNLTPYFNIVEDNIKNITRIAQGFKEWQ